ncbi:solute carrier family 13 member 1-like [Oreochromis aureus]|uniref:Solute carrier family 13 member 1 n=1 Tax=Oreochromis aureus TaxID=47969 RepID=A0AAZ1X2J0_OREAU|nr:solute carrier family 13 member 1-like [Oreochromis aureus]XP_039470312.1 solute carrier family 13 member 1-like [Oreochromis aureus]XP_039470313.1 solute carrier family 13 member 1-like [Oreochromis aureus]XP_039470314.1 solute carrier family 13 member 1-like [Oreochromis aureus]XP_039470315.1 solute carrier family 13 member 1-like [Oreochromis aureus]XP_039470316.1 solute carrier family 13 member 1-like [Oreochromis aureus]
MGDRRMLKKLSEALWNYYTLLLIILTPLLLIPLPLVIGTKEAECGFVMLLMAIYWVTEVIPLSMTAMLPAILFPLLGIMSSSNVAKEYFNNFHFLLVGVVCLATSIEKWGLHRRVALRLVTLVGVNPAWLLLGFMSGCAFLSMWVQNTSAVTMVMPIVDAVLQQILKAHEEGYSGEDNPTLELDEINNCTAKNKETLSDSTQPDVPTETFTSVQIPAESQPAADEAAENVPTASCRRRQGQMLCKAMCIGIAYSSSIGGITTLPGTSANLIFSEYLNQVYPDCNSINFGNWLLLCLPISVIMLLLTWFWLYWLFIGSDFKFLWQCRGEQSERERAVKKVLEDEYKKLGAISSQEIFTGVVFVVMILLWLTRSPGFIPGWGSLFPHKSNYITDATVALVLGVLLFFVPAHGPSRKYEAMISWKEFQASMPWQVALLVGGGFALAKGAEESGLSLWVARLMTPLGDLPVLATVTIACLIVTTLTEVTSNAATITIFLPILSPLAEAIHVNPLYILIPATLCTSFSFLLPVSNPPNAVVYAYGHITIMDMVKAGLGVNMIGVLALLLAIATWGIPLFSLDTYPEWAPTFNSTTP